MKVNRLRRTEYMRNAEIIVPFRMTSCARNWKIKRKE